MDKIRLKVLIKRAILDGIKYHYEMAELGRGCNFDQFAEDRVKDFETACDGYTSETGEWQSNIPVVTVSLPLSNDQILKGIQTSPRYQLPKEWLKNEHTNSNYMGGFLNAVKWMEGNAR